METTYVWVDPKGMKAYKTMPNDDRKALEKKGWVLTPIADAFDFLGADLGWGKSKNYGKKSQEFLTKMNIRAKKWFTSKTTRASQPVTPTVASQPTPPPTQTITISPVSPPKLGDLSRVSNSKLNNFLQQKFRGAGIEIENYKAWNKMLADLKNDKTALSGETLMNLKSTYGFKRGGILVKRK